MVIEVTYLVCSTCEGSGQVYFERPVIDYECGGYLEEYLDDCHTCNGNGEIENEIESMAG